MTIAPFGWEDFSPPGLDAANLEAMLQAAGAYTDVLRANITSGAAIPIAYVKATGASAGTIPVANGSNGYTWTAGGGGGTVTSVTAGDGTITIGGTSSAPTVKVNAASFDASGTATTAVAAEATLRTNADALKAPLASPALTGTPTAPTQTVNDNSTRVSTTAYADRSAANAAAGVTGSFATLASPAFTGNPTAPTQSVGDATTKLATTAYADRAATNAAPVASGATPLIDGTATAGVSALFTRGDHVHPTDTSRAALASPTFTGTPAVPTATAGTNTTQAASTAFTTAAVAVETSRATTAEALKAPLASPTFTGTPAVPTATAGTNTTQVASTAFVTTAVAGAGGGSSGSPLGLTGATAATRYVGGTATGAPTSGTFAVGDFVIDQTGKIWICTTLGTPGTWTQDGSVINGNFITGGGLFFQNIQTVNASATLSATATFVNITGAFTLTLNSPATIGRFVILKNSSTTATASVAIPSGGTIDGVTTPMSMPPLASAQLWCTTGSGSGTWLIVSYNAPPSNLGLPSMS